MPVELEAKVAVADFAPITERLRALGARDEGEVLETNTYFDTPDRALLAADSGLRVRSVRRPGSQPDRHVITFKGPRQPGAVKAREEIEFAVGDAELAGRLLSALGYRPDFSFEKRRRTWSLGDCEVVLDELPLLGRFVEVEGPGEHAIRRVLADIGLDGRPLVGDSYIAMLVDACARQGITERFLRLD